MCVTIEHFSCETNIVYHYNNVISSYNRYILYHNPCNDNITERIPPNISHNKIRKAVGNHRKEHKNRRFINNLRFTYPLRPHALRLIKILHKEQVFV